MKKTVFEIYRRTAELTLRVTRDLNALVSGCTQFDPEPEVVGRYNRIEDAKKAFSKFSADIDIIESFHRGHLINVTEYELLEREIEIDEDGDEYDCGAFDTIDVTPLPKELDWSYAHYVFDEWRQKWIEQFEEDEEDTEA